MNHQQINQGAPDPSLKWERFPFREVSSVLYRVCRKGLEAGWFSSDGSGRFDLRAPHGTCYLATEWPPAVLEVLGGELRGGLVCEEFFADRQVSLVAVRGYRLADTTHAHAATYGATSQLATIAPYEVPHAWAKFFHSLGWSGILYRLRFDPTAPPVGVAIFGDAGIQDLDVLRYEPFGPGHFRLLWQAYGIRVLPRPHLTEVVVVE